MEEEAYESPSPPLSPNYSGNTNTQVLFDQNAVNINNNDNIIVKNNVNNNIIEHECNTCHGALTQDDENDDDKTEKEISWIQCEKCLLWFHSICVDIQEFQSLLIDQYHCNKCEQVHGPSILRKIKYPHRYNFDNDEEANLSRQVGTKPWVDDFIKKEASIPEPSEKIMPIYENGEIFMQSFNWHDVWTNPIKILNKEGLGMRLPDDDFDIDTIEKIVDTEESIDTIDVYIQQSCKMKLKSFIEKWREYPRKRLYNMLSFEFSNTKLNDLIHAPELMYKLSWVHRIWNDGNSNFDDEYVNILSADHQNLRPDVALFCLLGMGGSYTDFHIDFGGSSVWYHVFKGKKIFYIVPPNDENLDLFLKWTNDDRRTETFYGNSVAAAELCRVEINPGETVMIPSGWIHAVYTPVDSIVFGGNFIHELNISMQLKIYDLELKAKYDSNFMFPNFELTNWYAGKALTNVLRNANEDEIPLPNYLISSLKSLLDSLSKWRERDKKNGLHLHDDFYYLVKELKDELRHYSKINSSKTPSKTPSPKRKSISRNNSYNKIMSLLHDASRQIKLEEEMPSTSKDTTVSGIKLKININEAKSNEKELEDRKYKKAEGKLFKLSKKERNQVSSMFNRTEGSGKRIVKPTAWVNNNVSMDTIKNNESEHKAKNFNAQFTKEELNRINRVDEIAKREYEQLGDNPYLSDELEDDFILDNDTRKRKKKKQTKEESTKQKIKAEPAEKKEPKKAKALQTPKQRLAKKLKMKF